MKQTGSVKAPDFLSGGGEMGERIRNFDWSKTPLGPPEYWEQSLKTCVHIMLTSSQPIWIGWGKELIKLYNDPYKAIVGGKHPQALGQPASVVWKDIWNDIEPMLNSVMNKDEGTYVESQLLIMERYGYPEETYFTFSYTPVLGEAGKPAGMICYNTADTERIINERSLQTLRQLDIIAQKKTEREIYQEAAKAIGTNDKDFPFVIVYEIQSEKNIARLVASAGINIDHPELQHTIDLEKPGLGGKNISLAVKENRIVESINNGRWKKLPKGAWNIMPQRYVHVPIKAANKKFPLAIVTLGLNPYRKFDDVFRNFVQLIADQISFGVNNALAYEEERKRAQMLEELDKAKTIFFSNISHEFRTPLTLMLGTIEEALNDVVNVQNTERLQMTHRNAMRLLKLVNTLLDFSRIESGRQKATYTLTDIVMFTKNLAGNFQSVIEKAGLKFFVQTDAINQPVYVDRQMWEKIVFNLLSNAFKYTLDGSIIVRIFADDKAAIFEVEDTGIGIPEDELPRMFERFHRVNNTIARTYEGTGIGLSLSKELVQLHGGTITVKSKLGMGSCFTVSIPLGKEHLDKEQTSESKTELEYLLPDVYIEEAASLLDEARVNSVNNQHDDEQNHNEHTETVLVVDDNADMRRHIQSVLQKHYKVVTAANGLQALQKIKTERPLLVLSDIMMPVMDGIELLKELKQNKQTVQLPVILLTARAGEESRIEGYETGADDYLVKPFAANELLARVKTQIHIAQTRKEVEERLRGFLMQAPAAIAIIEGADHVFTMANGLFQKVFGRTEEELINHTVKQAFPEIEGQGIYEIFDQVYHSVQPYIQYGFPATFNENGVSKTGYFDFVIHPIKNNKGEVNDLMAIALDVTESITARKKIEESEQRFRTLANEAPLFVWLTDKELYTTFLNETGLKYFNVHTIDGLSWKGFIHPDDIERVLKIMKDAALKNKPYTLEMRLKNAVTGNYRWFFDKGVPRYNGDEFIGFIGTSLDIDDRKQSEKILQESEARFRTLTEALPQLVLMTDEKGAQQFTSKSWLEYAGIMPAQEIWKDIVHSDDIRRFNEALLHNLPAGKSFKIEVRIKNKAGEYRWHYGQSEPIKDKDGKIVNWISAFTDVHDQKTFADKLEAEVAQRTFQLERSNKELESFNYIASHDLQEPLRKIQTFILLLEKSTEEKEVQKRYIDKITTSAQRMSQLIKSVLEYSRLSQTPVVFEATDLNQILENVISDYELLIAEKAAVIKSEKLPVIKAVSLQMQQLFSNLISNSLKFSNEDTVIKITCRIVTGKEININQEINAEQKFAEIKFADNGIGFDEQYSEQIFKLFQRLHSKSQYSGTGIGLSIVSKIIEKHNGFIKVESANNKGTTFTVWLPCE